MAEGMERRTAPRFKLGNIAVMVMDPLLERAIDAAPHLQDISEGGACLRTKAPVLPGENVRVRLSLPGGAPLEASARVRWAVDVDGGRQCGVQFVTFTLGHGALQDVLQARKPASVLARGFDIGLTLACAAVALVLMQQLMGRPELVRDASGMLGDTLPQLLVIGGALFGITLFLGR